MGMRVGIKTGDGVKLATDGSLILDAPYIESFMQGASGAVMEVDTTLFSFTGLVKPTEGKSRWYPHVNSTLNSFYASIESSPLSPVVMQVLKNGVPLTGSIIIAAGEYKSDTLDLNAEAVTPADAITVNILSGNSGADIFATVVFNYSASGSGMVIQAPRATATSLGYVKVGDGLSIDETGTISVLPANLNVADNHDITVSHYGSFVNNQGILLEVASKSYKLDGTGSAATLIAPTSNAVLYIKKNNVDIGTITFNSSSTEGLVQFNSPTIDVVEGDLITIVASPTIETSGLTDVAISLGGVGVIRNYMPVASGGNLGGIKIGQGLVMSPTGILSVSPIQSIANATVSSVETVVFNYAGYISTTEGTRKWYPYTASTLTQVYFSLGTSSSSDVTVKARVNGVIVGDPIVCPAMELKSFVVPFNEVLTVNDSLSFDIIGTSGADAYIVAVYTIQAATHAPVTTASSTVLGGVKVGTGLVIDSNGILSSNAKSDYPLSIDSTLFSFTGAVSPTVGKSRWYPHAGCTLLKCFATIETVAASDVVLQLNVNGVPVGAPIIITANAYKSATVDLTNILTTDDYVTVDIISGNSGSDVYVTLVSNYVSSASNVGVTLPIATESALGMMKVGNGLSVDATGSVSAIPVVTTYNVNDLQGYMGLGVQSATPVLVHVATKAESYLGTGIAFTKIPVLNDLVVDILLQSATSTAFTTLGSISFLSGSSEGVFSVAPFTLAAKDKIKVTTSDSGFWGSQDPSQELSITLYSNNSALPLPLATASSAGAVKVGAGLSVDVAGVLSANVPTIPKASASIIGGIKIGAGLAINASGVVTTTTTGADFGFVTTEFNFSGVTAPTVGTTKWYPSKDTTITGIFFTCQVAPTTPVLVQVRINGVVVPNSSALCVANEFKSSFIPLSLTVTTADYVTLDITEGSSGEDITAYLEYQLPVSGIGGGTTYVLPPATDLDLGGIRIGTGLSIDVDGIVSVTGGGGSGTASPVGLFPTYATYLDTLFQMSFTNDLTVQGAFANGVPVTTGTVSYGTGVFGGTCLTIDPASYVTIPFAASAPYTKFVEDNMTIEMWLKVSEYPLNDTVFFEMRTSDGSTSYIRLYLSSNGSIFAAYLTPNDNLQMYSTDNNGAVVQLNTWTHISLQMYTFPFLTGGMLRGLALSLNGIQGGSTDDTYQSSPPLEVENSILLGDFTGNTTFSFNISDLRITPTTQYPSLRSI